MAADLVRCWADREQYEDPMRKPFECMAVVVAPGRGLALGLCPRHELEILGEEGE